ncbi:MAG: MarR family transcriptional regulator [Chloroflexi bacterium]|nr:MarR family transcriptional regulator [Chloroflexota bacterium]MDA1297756.1 MarR family transcriptional regulator [Chloroflexota bacterium]
MSDPLNTDEVKVWKMFLRAHAALMRVMDSRLQQSHGMSMTWMDILVQLSLAEKQRLTHTRLSERVLLTGGGTTRAVDRMAEAGLVVRRASRKDRRTSFVVLTDKGAAALREMTSGQLDAIEELFSRHLRKDDIPVIRAFFERVLGEE